MHELSVLATPSRAAHRLGLVCLGAGHEEGRVYEFPHRRLHAYHLLVIAEGSGTYRDAAPHARRVELTAPCALWLPPGHQHRYAPGPLGWKASWMLLEGRAVELLLRSGMPDLAWPVLDLDPASVPPVERWRALATSLGGSGLRAEARASHLALGLVLDVLDAAVTSAVPPLTALLADCTNGGTVHERARRLGLAVAELRDLVRAEAGRSITDFVIDSRILLAKQALAGSAAPISDIARRVGFDDPAYFSRIFARRVGMPPRDYRRRCSGLTQAHDAEAGFA